MIGILRVEVGIIRVEDMHDRVGERHTFCGPFKIVSLALEF